MTSTDEKVGKKIQQLRDAADMSKTQLAARLSEAGLGQIHPTTVSRIESGERAIRLSEAVTIAQVLGTNVEALLDYGGIEALMKQARYELGLAQKSFKKLRGAVEEVLGRQASLAYALENLRAVGFDEIESDYERGRARAVEFELNKLANRKLPQEVEAVVDEWEESFENFLSGDENGVGQATS